MFPSLKGVKHLFLLETFVSPAPDIEFEGVCEVFTSKLDLHPFHPFAFFFPIPFHTINDIYMDPTQRCEVRER